MIYGVERFSTEDSFPNTILHMSNKLTVVVLGMVRVPCQLKAVNGNIVKNSVCRVRGDIKGIVDIR